MIIYILIGVDLTDPENPYVIGLYKDLKSATKIQKELQNNNPWDKYVVQWSELK